MFNNLQIQIRKRNYAEDHHVPPFGLVNLNVKIRKEGEAPHTWEVLVNVLFEGKQIGSSKSLIILRDKMRANFHSIMDMHSDETHQLSTSIFTGQGNFRPVLMTNHVQRGSGVWGNELSEGGLLLIETIDVVPAFQHKGLGQWILAQTLRVLEVNAHCRFAFAWPSANVDSEISQSEFETRSASVLQFFHKSGFRRVGRSPFLCFAMHNAHHFSRILPIELDPPRLDVPPISTEEACASYPLHADVVGESDDKLDEIIRKVASTNKAALHTQDFCGNTPLHAAAYIGKVNAVRTLLANGCDIDLATTNNDGLTPLQMLETELQEDREFFAAMIASSTRPWLGNEQEKCEVLLELWKALGKPIPQAQPSLAQWTVFQWGCTCGLCQAGWLSPRMRTCLQRGAQMAANATEHDLFPARTLIPGYRLSIIQICRCIPSDISMGGVYPSYLKGLSIVLSAIARVLGNESVLFSSNTVRAELWNSPDLRCVDHYFKHGGTIEHALLGVVQQTWDEHLEEHGATLPLPACANDADYDLVCNRLKIPIYETEFDEFDGFEDMMDDDDDGDDGDDDEDDGEDDENDEDEDWDGEDEDEGNRNEGMNSEEQDELEEGEAEVGDEGDGGLNEYGASGSPEGKRRKIE